MVGTTFSGTITTGVTLNNPATQRPATVTGTITDSTTGAALYGNIDVAWTVINQGTVENTGTTGGTAIQLSAGGTVNNQIQPSVSPSGPTGGSLIEGYGGILIQGAAGAVTNLGSIKATGTNADAVYMTAGGTVSNGNASDTNASISGGRHGVFIKGAAGAVTNFGTISDSGAGAAVILFAGGNVTNGSAASTAALINAAGGHTAIYVNYGAGVVTNFGTATGSSGVFLATGGRITNGQSGSTAGLITGTSGSAALISGGVGTVANFGTIQETGTAAAVALVAGGIVTNGASGAATALITSSGGSGVYANNSPGTVTNFGAITATSTASGDGINLESGGTVTNFGTVQNTDTSDADVYFHGGGSLTNSKTGTSVGLISGAGTGVSVRGGAGTVTNSGSITSSTANGVYLNGGGSVTNQAGGVIAGHSFGVYGRGVAITVINSGLIETTGTADGIYLRGGGSITNNSGGTIAGSAAGVEVGQQGGVVTNHGVIEGVIGFYGEIHHSGANTLINFGTVASTSGTAGIAVQMGSSVGLEKLLVVEPGAVFTGLVEGGGRGEIEFAATGTAAMGGNISGFETVALANGAADSLTLVQANFTGVSSNRITVIGGNSGNTVNASAVTSSQVTIIGGAGADILTGDAGGNAHFVFTDANLTASDKVTGSGSNNELDVTTPGTIAAAGVSAVQIYRLANGGPNTLTLTDANFTGLVPRPMNVYGGTGGNTIDGSGITGTTNNLDIYGGAGADVLKGGAGSDIFVFTAANLTSTDTISGGGGNNELLMTTAGTVAVAGVSGVETYVLANGGANVLTLGTANFTGVTGSTITVSGGNGGNTVSASGVTAPDRIIVYAGTGADNLTGGPGNDIFYAGGDTTMTGGAGANEFIFSAPGTNTIADFGASATNEILFSNTGFNLGLSGSGPLPAGLFVIGPFTGIATQRFAYNSGQLFYSPNGTAAAEKLVATLTGAPALTASELFYTTTTSTTYSGVITTGVGLGNPATQRSVTVTGTITNASGQGIVGNFDFPWTINNRGTVENTGTTSSGIQLLAGGTVNNVVAASGTATPGSLIEGYNAGVLIEFAAGVVSNLGAIEDTGANGIGVNVFDAGGRVVNGSATDTTALISGPGTAVAITGGAGSVTNFGTMQSTGLHTAIVFDNGGSIANGSSTSTVALISSTGTFNAISVSYGGGTVTNFGSIKGGNTGVFFDDGGRVTNGASGSTAGLIQGGTGGAVSIAGTTGTIANFGMLQSLGTLAVVALNGVGGGTVTNGAVGATSAAITGPGTGIYVNNGPGTITNFGQIKATSASAGNGIVLERGGIVTNFGTVQNTDTADAGVYLHGGGSVTNGKTGTSVGLISGANNAVSFRGGAGTVVNAGSITSATNNGVYMNGGGNVTNQAGGVIAGHNNGVYGRGVAITVVNSGLIETTGTADGIYLRGGGTVTNNAGATIAGSAAGVYFHRTAGMVTNHGVIKGTIGFDAAGAGANTLVNFGTVASTSTATGAIAVEMGNNVGKNLLIVEAGAVFTGLVEGGGRGEIEFAATGTAAMGGNISGFSTVALANGGADSLTLAQANFTGVTPGRITVIGSNDGNTVNASAVTSAVTINGGAGADVLTGDSGGNAIFVFTATALTATDKITGSGRNNELEVTTAGTVNAAGVTGVDIYHLANGGANSLTLANTNFTGLPSGDHITIYGGTGGNTIDGSALTGATDNLDIYGGAGADVLKGGAGNDVFSFTAANLTATDTISGGAGTNELLVTTAGTAAAAGVSGVETYVLANGGADTLTLASANFTAVAGSTITIAGGNGGNTISAAGVAAPDRIIVYAGVGADALTGGAGNDVFYAGGKTTMTGGAGTNEFVFSSAAAATNVIADFAASATNEAVFSNSGFALALSGATSTPKALPAGLFTSNSTGAFTAATQRFAYDTANGQLFYSAAGTTATEHLVATLSGTPVPNLTASHLFFVS